MYATNLAILQHFYDAKYVMQLFGTTLMSSELQVELPNFDLYTSRHEHRLAADSKSEYELG